MEFGLVQVWQSGWIDSILRGAGVTVSGAVLIMVIGGVFGVICCLIK